MVEGTIITFGKYKGVSWEHLVNADPAYIVWYDKTISNPKQRNCPISVIDAAYQVLAVRNQANMFTGNFDQWDWDHPSYIQYTK